MGLTYADVVGKQDKLLTIVIKSRNVTLCDEKESLGSGHIARSGHTSSKSAECTKKMGLI